MLVINMVNGIFYEGAFAAGFFGKTSVTWSFCMYIFTCCQWDYNEVEKNDMTGIGSDVQLASREDAYRVQND